MCDNINALYYTREYCIREILVGNFFRELQVICKKNCLVLVDKDRSIALIRENIICEMLYLSHSRKFSHALHMGCFKLANLIPSVIKNNLNTMSMVKLL